MKRKMKRIVSMCVVMLMALTGCSNNIGKSELPYDNQIHTEDNRAYVKELFYRNDLGTEAPDPCVIRITDKESSEYGYYYLYGTTDPTMGFRAYRNKDLTGDWEDVTTVTNEIAFCATEEHFAYEAGSFWAPEVIYDEDADKYYMFYSGALEKGHRMIAVAEAEEPYGPFSPVTTDGLDASKPLFDNDVMMAKMKEMGAQKSGVFNCIDPHPYVAPDGTKYLYFVHEVSLGNAGSGVWGVQMTTWTKPDLSTLKELTIPGYYTVDESWSDEEGSTEPLYEAGNTINEGPYMYELQNEDGTYKYLLCFSINGYTNKSYSVIQAESDHPLGPYRKLTEEEGGILLSTDWEKFDHMSGTGHHSFVEVEDELFIVYHEHVARETGGTGPRDIAVDRVKVVKNGKGDSVLYCNGPTWSLQPRIDTYSGYKNLALEATVKASTGENVEALTDDLLSIYTNNTFVKEFEAEKTTTITMSFDDYKEISAIMIYNSKTFVNSFVDIKRIEFDYQDADGEGTAYIENLAFDWDFYKMESINEMRPGGSSVAVFNPLKCKEIRITIELPETRPEGIEIMDEYGYYLEQTKIGVSEIVVLGK